MPMWRVAPVSDEPTTLLREWRIVEVQTANAPNPTLHALGYAVDLGEGRMSSALISIDAASHSARSSSDRLYTFAGPPGCDPDAEYVYGHWMRRNGATLIADRSNLMEALNSPASDGDSGSET